MAKCAECGKEAIVAIMCEYCKKYFCSEHIYPVAHHCDKAERWNVILKTFEERKDRGEIDNVLGMENDFNSCLTQICDTDKINDVIKFGEKFSILELALYLRDMFGPSLFFDSLLTIVQQYSMADAEIKTHLGKGTMWTGFNLALFGHPGTGKTFASYDMIMGKERAGVPPHGLPGRNRYCGGMTPAKFVDVGQAYEGKKYVFIVTEFNDWFKYKGMVEPLKLALERGKIQKETMHETIRPYKFTSFFSANYNVKVQEKGYKTTTTDPNFNAIEDRMVCRLHRLTIERYRDIAESAKRMALGKLDFKFAEKIRDHLTFVHAIQSGYKVENFEYKPVLLTEEVYESMKVARECILEHLKFKETLDFSPRLEMRAIQLAAAMSLLDYFGKNEKMIPINKEAVKLAVKFYVEEASVRSKEQFKPEWVLYDLGISPKFVDKTSPFRDHFASEEQ